ncbi:Integrase core domain [Popillia japonica]|uniref:Integrase core domain n=1 Tax=Popillia japonica TaxID=7064 RepID=A0AAW1HF82_POPJA
MRSYVKNHIRSCFDCLLTKIPGGKRPGRLHPLPPPSRPFSRIHIDHLGPFVKSKKGNAHLIVIVDALTKYVYLSPVRSTKTKYVITTLTDFILEYGLPEIIVSDRGTSYTAKEFTKFCDERGIQHILNSSRWPQANGQVERVNRTVVPVIMACMSEEDEWDKKIKEVQRNLNAAENKTTKMTAYEALYGYSPEFSRNTEGTMTTWHPPEELRKEMIERIKEMQSRYKDHYDKKRYDGVKYECGDVVVMLRAAEQTGQPTKTQAKYRGPLVVTECLPNDTYRVSDLRCNRGRTYTTTAHVAQLKIYQNHHDDIEGSGDETDTDRDSLIQSSEEEEKNSDEKERSEVNRKIGTQAEERIEGKRAVRRPRWLKEYVVEESDE